MSPDASTTAADRAYDELVTGQQDQPGRARGPYRKSSERRRQIIASAISLFATRGVDGSSLRTLGEAIGVSHSALRHYFASRDELLVEVYRAHEHTISDGGAQPPLGPVSTMIAGARRNRSIPGLVRLYATLTTDALQEQHPATRTYVRERFRSLRAQLEGQIREAQRQGTVAEEIDAADAAALVIAASDGLQIQWLLDPEEVDVGSALSLLARILPEQGA